VPHGAFVTLLPGQNGFVSKAKTGRLTGIDSYLVNSWTALGQVACRSLRTDSALFPTNSMSARFAETSVSTISPFLKRQRLSGSSGRAS